ncbi:MAG: tryptophan-rich sensory protein [Nitrosomonas sp.]|nr:tryptophan-rich sensory protein [Nitrosomonas sp.]
MRKLNQLFTDWIHLKKPKLLKFFSRFLFLTVVSFFKGEKKMVFESKQALSIFTFVAIFVLRKYSMTNEDIEWYNTAKKTRLPSYLQFPSWVFPVVWTILDACLVVSHFFYFEYAADFTYWTFVAVFATSLINIILNDQWSRVFFGMRQIAMSLVVSTAMFITAVLVTIFMGLSQPSLGDMYWLPLILYIPYCAWLGVAWWINFNWNRYEMAASDKRKPLLQQTKSKIDHHPLV